MSSEWPLIPIGELAELFDGPHATPKKTQEGPVFLGISSLQSGQLDLTVTEHLSEEDFKKWTKRVLPQENDVVFSYETRIGQAAILPAGLRCCLGRRMALLRPNPSKLLPRYLIYYFLSHEFQEFLRSRTIQGSTVQRLALTEFPEYPIRIPPIEVQSAISSVLKAIDDRITLLRETNTTLEAIAQALFKSWFVDFAPVHAKQQGRAPEGMDAQTAALFPDSFEESELGMVPRGWSFCSLKEVASIHDSKRIPLSGAERKKRQGKYPYYGAAALMDYVDDYIFDGIYLLTGEDGSVADENGYPITQYVWGRFWVNNHAHILQGKNGVSTEHLMLFLKQTNIQPFITGAVQAKLSQSNMWRINFIRPPLNISEAFGAIISPLYEALRQNAEQANSLTELRDTLLPRLISGQLRLPEAQVLVEDAVDA